MDVCLAVSEMIETINSIHLMKRQISLRLMQDEWNTAALHLAILFIDAWEVADGGFAKLVHGIALVDTDFAHTVCHTGHRHRHQSTHCTLDGRVFRHPRSSHCAFQSGFFLDHGTHEIFYVTVIGHAGQTAGIWPDHPKAIQYNTSAKWEEAVRFTDRKW
jgi:hypothetical protein